MTSTWECPHGRPAPEHCEYCLALGEENTKSKLTNETAIEALRLVRAGHSKASIGRRFGVTARTIGFIEEGVTWWHVTGVPRRQRGVA